MAEESGRTRRALLTGGAVLLGGAVLANEGTAEAADGHSFLLGRSNKASHSTALTGTGTAAALSVTSTRSAAIKATSSVHTQPAVAAYNPGDSKKHDAVAIRGTVGKSAAGLLKQISRAGAGSFAGPVGVVAVGAGGGTGLGVGVASLAPSAGDWAVAAVAVAGATAIQAQGKSQFNGDVAVSGTLSKSGGSFKIDHPQDPANKYLSHSFVESPDMKNVYDGVVAADAHGKATVTLPDWFESLNRDFRYQLTALRGAAPNLHVSELIEDGVFTVAGAQPHQEVSWQVTGIRKDAWANDHRIPTEETKPEAERGTYLYPAGFGKPIAAGLAALTAPQIF